MLVSMTSANELLNPKPAMPSALRAVVLAVSETIRDVGDCPAGPLYAALMAHGCTLHQFEMIIETLKHAKLIEETPSHLLRWVGPLKGAK